MRRPLFRRRQELSLLEFKSPSHTVRSSCELDFLKKKFTQMTHEQRPLQFHTGLFLGKYDGEITLNEELESFQKLTYEELETMITKNPVDFVPAFIDDFRKVKDRLRE